MKDIKFVAVSFVIIVFVSFFASMADKKVSSDNRVTEEIARQDSLTKVERSIDLDSLYWATYNSVN